MLSMGVSTKVKACKSFYSLKVPSKLKIIKSLWMRRSFSQLDGIREGCDQNGDRVSKNDVSCHICIR